jgi:uncharacterized protein YraI
VLKRVKVAAVATAALCTSLALGGAAGAVAPNDHKFTTVAAVNVRQGPGTSYPITRTLPSGSVFYTTCWTTGSSVNGDNIWYYDDDQNTYYTDFVAGYYLNTGHDPNPTVPECAW